MTLGFAVNLTYCLDWGCGGDHREPDGVPPDPLLGDCPLPGYQAILQASQQVLRHIIKVFFGRTTKRGWGVKSPEPLRKNYFFSPKEKKD